MRFPYEIPVGIRRDDLQLSEFDTVVEFHQTGSGLMVEPPPVTVCIPLHNYGHMLVETLGSVREQTIDRLDLCIVDDASTDSSLQVAVEWVSKNRARFGRASVLKNRSNSRLSVTRNNAFHYSRTELVFPLDADNTLYPRCVARCVEICRATDCDFVFPMIEMFGEKRGLMGVDLWDPTSMQPGNLIDAMALIKKSSWEAVGGYHDIRYGWEDYDFWCKFFENGFEGIQLPEILARYRVHGSSMLRTMTNLLDIQQKLVPILRERHPWLTVSAEPSPG